ncbi:MAG: hypothetical protein GY715_19390 [Planctomycetes bacterium]|nr:hypothetical protein [Planctomycetota bacterium]
MAQLTRSFVAAAVLFISAQAGASCVADMDESGVVDPADLVYVIGHWGPCSGCRADLDGSGDVGFADLLRVIGAWGPAVFFEYGPPRDDAEAEQIGLEMLGVDGSLVLPDDL